MKRNLNINIKLKSMKKFNLDKKTITIIPEHKFTDFKIEKVLDKFVYHYVIEPQNGCQYYLGDIIYVLDLKGNKHYPKEVKIESITETEINLSYSL